MTHHMTMKHVALTILILSPLAAWGDGPADNNPESVRQVPPPGIEIAEDDRADLTQRTLHLHAQIETLSQRREPLIAEYLPDVEIFHRAVDQALRFNEMFQPADVGRARELLEEGERRASQLAAGETPWTTQTGLVVRGYRSRLDGTVQPYGLVVPSSYSASGADRHRCDIWFHGRGERSMELQFIDQRMKQVGQYAPRDTLVLHPYGRYSNAFKFAGEVDVLEALEHVQQNYRIDDDRISVRGFSMGGAGAWQFAIHYADRWFAANPGAGFSETPEFLKSFQGETLNPPWWEERLWQYYDCPPWVANLQNCPIVAYSGEIDRQKQAADVMEAAFRASTDMELRHIIGPETAHAIHPDSKIEIERRMDDLAALGRERAPEFVRLRTPALKYNRMSWLTINGLAEHWQPSGVDARLDLSRRRPRIILAPQGVTDLSLKFDAGHANWRRAPEIVIAPPADGGEPITLADVPALASDRSWECRLFRDESGNWQVGTPPWEGKLHKQHDLQGPIDDALLDSFLFVSPSGTSAHSAVETWVHAELDHAIVHWRQQMRGDARVKVDTDVTDDDIAQHNLILWGDPKSNAILGRIADQLPISWTADTVQVGDKTFDATHHAPVLIYPNPLNPERYVVLNSSFTYREYDYLNNARQTPKLPDWAVVDLREPPGTRWPGKIVAAGFFGESWELP